MPEIALDTINMIMFCPHRTKLISELRIRVLFVHMHTLAAPLKIEPNKKTPVPKSSTFLRPQMSENLENRGSGK